MNPIKIVIGGPASGHVLLHPETPPTFTMTNRETGQQIVHALKPMEFSLPIAAYVSDDLDDEQAVALAEKQVEQLLIRLMAMLRKAMTPAPQPANGASLILPPHLKKPGT